MRVRQQHRQPAVARCTSCTHCACIKPVKLPAFVHKTIEHSVRVVLRSSTQTYKLGRKERSSSVLHDTAVRAALCSKCTIAGRTQEAHVQGHGAATSEGRHAAA